MFWSAKLIPSNHAFLWFYCAPNTLGVWRSHGKSGGAWFICALLPMPLNIENWLDYCSLSRCMRFRWGSTPFIAHPYLHQELYGMPTVPLSAYESVTHSFGALWCPKWEVKSSLGLKRGNLIAWWKCTPVSGRTDLHRGQEFTGQISLQAEVWITFSQPQKGPSVHLTQDSWVHIPSWTDFQRALILSFDIYIWKAACNGQLSGAFPVPGEVSIALQLTQPMELSSFGSNDMPFTSIPRSATSFWNKI